MPGREEPRKAFLLIATPLLAPPLWAIVQVVATLCYPHLEGAWLLARLVTVALASLSYVIGASCAREQGVALALLSAALVMVSSYAAAKLAPSYGAAPWEPFVISITGVAGIAAEIFQEMRLSGMLQFMED